MKNSRTIIAKAAADTSALGTGGKMNAEQASQFITFMQDSSSFLKKVFQSTLLVRGATAQIIRQNDVTINFNPRSS